MQKHLTTDPITPFQPHHQSVKFTGAVYRTEVFFVFFVFFFLYTVHNLLQAYPGGSSDKESAYNVGDLGLIPELGRFPGEGNGNPLQYSWPEKPGGLQSMGLQRVRSD